MFSSAKLKFAMPSTSARKPRAIGLRRRPRLSNEIRAKADVVGALMRHPVAEQVATASRDNAEPAPRILLEHRTLERIELVTDENGDGHKGTPMLIHVIASVSEAIHTSRAENGLLRRYRSSQ